LTTTLCVNAFAGAESLGALSEDELRNVVKEVAEICMVIADEMLKTIEDPEE